MPDVLVVDDSPVDRMLVQSILQKDPELAVRLAANGREAMEALRREPADVVVTDLQMPELNGLELLTAMSLEFPQIPVVLTTAHGSEELAVQALQAGAASYVPKPQLASRLLPIVEQVFEMTQLDRSYDRFAQSMEWAEFQMSLENDFELVDRCIDLIQSMSISTQKSGPSENIRLGSALRAALQEAILRGNLEFSAEQARAFDLESPESAELHWQRMRDEKLRTRRLRFRARLSRTESRFVIGYDGPPFELDVPSSEGERAALSGGAGRGILLLTTYMDSVQSDPERRELTIIKQAVSSA